MDSYQNQGLKVAAVALNKIRESVKYIKGSETRMKKFQECVQAVGSIDNSVGLRLDLSIRWNSTYLMLESAVKYKKVFASLQFNDKNYKSCPSSEDWKRGEKIYKGNEGSAIIASTLSKQGSNALEDIDENIEEKSDGEGFDMDDIMVDEI